MVELANLYGKIVFLKAPDRGARLSSLWSVDPKTGNQKLLIKSFGGYSGVDFSPDLSHIVFTRGSLENIPYSSDEIFSVRINGTQQKQFTDNGYSDRLTGVAYSPDGRSILWTRWTGSHMGGPMNRDADIWIMDADGSNKRRLIGDYRKYPQAQFDAKWSRDGQRVFYQQTEEAIYEGTDVPAPTPRVWTIKGDGTDARLATDDEVREATDGLSPDKKQRLLIDERDSKRGEIYIQSVDGNVTRRITKNDGHEFSPRFSPNGKQIVFGIRPPNTNPRQPPLPSMWIVNTDGSGLKKLLDGSTGFMSVVRWLG